jgi:integrase
LAGSLIRARRQEVADYYEFAFFSGLRPNEQIEIHRSDMDMQKRTAQIARGKVEGEVKDTKTYELRIVELHSRAYAVLLRQKERTYLAGKHVFLNPFTGKAYVDERSQRRFFNFVVKKLQIRQRPAKNTRHTYATLLLMSEANPAWAAEQLGHCLHRMSPCIVAQLQRLRSVLRSCAIIWTRGSTRSNPAHHPIILASN